MNTLPSAPNRGEWRAQLLASAVLFALTLGMFADALFAGDSIVASDENGDVREYFSVMREFGYEQMRAGNVPLWNPYNFCGTPFLAGMQSSLLYPFNVSYFALPLAKALNLEIAFHIWLVGVLMFAWARNRGLRFEAALLSAVTVMFSGAYFLHELSGHLTLLSAWAWAPLVFLAADKLIDGARAHGAFAGAAALTLIIYAGHPQALYCTLVVLGAYAGGRWLFAANRQRSALLLSFMLLAPLVLGAAQLWPTLAASGESVRAAGLPYHFASRFSFPPENLVTIVVPKLFGDYVHTTYVGRWVVWETSLFIGCGALTLAIYGILFGSTRQRWWWALLALGIVLVALGRYTILFKVLYKLLPGFSGFRSPSKFMFHATLFLALLAGLGMHTLLERRFRVRSVAFALFVAATLLALGALTLSESLWAAAIDAMRAGGDVWYTWDPKVPPVSTVNARYALAVAAGTCAALSLAWFLSARWRWPVYGVLLISIIELFVFARSSRPTFDLDAVKRPDIAMRLEPGADYRVWDWNAINVPMSLRVRDIWGYDPAQLLRYTEFMQFSQGGSLEASAHEVPFKPVFHPWFAMLGCRYVIDSRKPELWINEAPAYLPRFVLVPNYRVVTDPVERFNQMLAPTFDPRDVVLLESQPDPAPKPFSAGNVSLLSEATDELRLEVNVDAPCLLLIADAYAKDWKAVGVGDSVQSDYTVMPANHVLRAIPLRPGLHRIHMIYDPAAWTFGRYAALLSVPAFMLGWFLTARRRKSSHAA